MESLIEYVFGTGDGPTTTWHSAADLDFDGDGILDAVRLDFDGDGRVDDAMVDLDGDGRADVSALDLDDDGVCEARFADSGRGLWDRPVGADPPGPQARGSRVELDTDGDGHDDVVLITPGRGGRLAERMYVDTDGDGRPDQVLVDQDGDGRADTWYGSSDPRFGSG